MSGAAHDDQSDPRPNDPERRPTTPPRLEHEGIGRLSGARTLREAGLDLLVQEAAFDPALWPRTELDVVGGSRIETLMLPNGGTVHAVLTADYRHTGLAHLSQVLKGIRDQVIDPSKWVFVEETRVPGFKWDFRGKCGVVFKTLSDRTGASVETAVKNVNAPEPLLGTLARSTETSPPLDRELLIGCAAIIRAKFSPPSPLDYFGAVNFACSDWGIPPDAEILGGLRLLMRGDRSMLSPRFVVFEETLNELQRLLGHPMNFNDRADVELLRSGARTRLSAEESYCFLFDQFSRSILGGPYPNLGSAILDVSDIAGEHATDLGVFNAVRRCYQLDQSQRAELSRRYDKLTDEEEPKATEAALGKLLRERPDVQVVVIVAHEKFAGSIAAAVKSLETRP